LPFNRLLAFSWLEKLKRLGNWVELKVYDNLGREVKTLVKQVMPPGRHEATFEANGVATGLYFYRLYVDGQVFTKSMMLVK